MAAVAAVAATAIQRWSPSSDLASRFASSGRAIASMTRTYARPYTKWWRTSNDLAPCSHSERCRVSHFEAAPGASEHDQTANGGVAALRLGAEQTMAIADKLYQERSCRTHELRRTYGLAISMHTLSSPSSAGTPRGEGMRRPF